MEIETKLFFTQPGLFGRLRPFKDQRSIIKHRKGFLSRTIFNIRAVEGYYASQLPEFEDDPYSVLVETEIKALGGGASGAFVFLVTPTYKKDKYLIKIYFDAFVKFGKDRFVRNDRPIREAYALSRLNGERGFPSWKDKNAQAFIIDPANKELWQTFFRADMCEFEDMELVADIRGLTVPKIPVLACAMSRAKGKALMDLSIRNPAIDPLGTLLEIYATYQRFSKKMENGAHWDLHPDNIFVDFENPSRGPIPLNAINTFLGQIEGSESWTEMMKGGFRWIDDWASWTANKMLKPFEMFIQIGKAGEAYLDYFKQFKEAKRNLLPGHRVAAVLHYLFSQLHNVTDEPSHASCLFQSMFGNVVHVDGDFNDLPRAIFNENLPISDFVDRFGPRISTTLRNLYEKKKNEKVLFPTITLIDFDLVTCDAFPALNAEHQTKLNAKFVGCLTERLITWMMRNVRLKHVEEIIHFLQRYFIPSQKEDTMLVDHCHLIAYTFVMGSEAMRRRGMKMDDAISKIKQLLLAKSFIQQPKILKSYTKEVAKGLAAGSLLFLSKKVNLLVSLLTIYTGKSELFIGIVLAAFKKLAKNVPLAPDDMHLRLMLEPGEFNIVVAPLNGDLSTIVGSKIPSVLKSGAAWIYPALTLRGLNGFLLNISLRMVGILCFGSNYGLTGQKQLHLVNLERLQIRTSLKNKQFSFQAELNLAFFVEARRLGGDSYGPKWDLLTKNKIAKISKGSWTNTPTEQNKYLLYIRSVRYDTLAGGKRFLFLLNVASWAAAFINGLMSIVNGISNLTTDFMCKQNYKVFSISSQESILPHYMFFLGEYDNLKEKNPSGSLFLVELFVPNADPTGFFTCLQCVESPFTGLTTQLDCMSALNEESNVLFESGLLPTLTPRMQIQIGALSQKPITVASIDTRGRLVPIGDYGDGIVGELMHFIKTFSLANLAMQAVQSGIQGPFHHIAGPWLKKMKFGLTITELVGILSSAGPQLGDSFFRFGDPLFLNFVETLVGPLYALVGVAGLGTVMADFAFSKLKLRLDELNTSLVAFLEIAHNAYLALKGEDRISTWRKLIVDVVLDQMCGNNELKWDMYRRLSEIPRHNDDLFVDAEDDADFQPSDNDFEQPETNLLPDLVQDDDVFMDIPIEDEFEDAVEADEFEDARQADDYIQDNHENNPFQDMLDTNTTPNRTIPISNRSPSPMPVQRQPMVDIAKQPMRRSDSGMGSMSPFP